MELSWTTFVLEMINFLVLVWILVHFLYRPVLGILQKRRDNIETILEEAKQKYASAENLQQQYEGRLAEWEQEKQQKRDQLQQEIQSERQKRLKLVNTEIDDQRKKAEVIEQRLKSEQQLHLQQEALLRASRFSAKLLTAVTSPQLESQLIDLLIKDISSLAEERLQQVRQSCDKTLDKIQVSSAYPIDKKQQNELEKILLGLCSESAGFQYHQDAELVAGVRISMGAWIIGMNLQDELEAFTTFSHD